MKIVVGEEGDFQALKNCETYQHSSKQALSVFNIITQYHIIHTLAIFKTEFVIKNLLLKKNLGPCDFMCDLY